MLSLDSYIHDVKKKQINMDAVMVIQDGETRALHRFSDEIYHNVFSVAKSYTSTGIGMAVDEGLLHLTDKPVDMFSEILPQDLEAGWADVTLKHLLTMTSGHGRPHLMAVDRRWLRGETDRPVDPEIKEEWLRYAFGCPVVYNPGEVFCYGNLAPYVAGRMLEKAVGTSVREYLYEKLWKPMGTDIPRWDADNAGHTFPASDLFLDITDMIKLGQLYLNKGVYNGKRYLSEEWISQATSLQVSSSVINPAGAAPDEECGYGFYFWMNSREGYRCYGREGQFVMVLPEKNAVIATMAMHSDVQAVLDPVWEHLYPQL